MQRNFIELQKFLEYSYPELVGNVQGTFYPPPPFALALANLGTLALWGGIALTFLGETLFRAAGLAAPPGWFRSMKANPMPVVGGLFALNAVAGGFAKTGAFEVYLNGETVFSKLESGRFPNAEDIYAGMKRVAGLNPTRQMQGRAS
mmetsp:Transcript_6494/g.9641  ORF Transcript_6494/g.9641 Transcript_6494/m.9641 type:complete len:147 (-) Transcript_6494:602-1042(-)